MIAAAAHPGRRGFTMIEALLTIALSVMIVGGATAFYRHAMLLRDRLQATVELAADHRGVMDRITGDLRGAMVYPFLSVSLRGATGSMTFLNSRLPGKPAWAVRTALEDPIPPEFDLAIVGYRLRIVEDDDGEPVVVGLERTEQRVVLAQTAEEGEEIEGALLSDRIKFLRLRYLAQAPTSADEDPWLDEWNQGELPLAVEIILGREPLPEGVEPVDYPYETHRRVVYVPSSAAASAGGAPPRMAAGEE